MSGERPIDSEAIRVPREMADFAGFQERYRWRYGSSHPGLDFWFENDRVDIVSRYRAFATTTHPNGGDGWTAGWIALLWGAYYASIGFEDYIPRQVHNWQVAGLTRSQTIEVYAIAFLEAGPRGMETVARGLRDYRWQEPEPRTIFPDNWQADPEAFRSGIDLDSPDLTASELRLLVDWYERVAGEVPPYVPFLARYRPDVLKAYRARFETVVRELPKQMLPALLLHHNVVRGMREGIRENALLARGFGVTREQALQIVSSTGLYGVGGPMNTLIAAAADVFDDWA